MEIIIHCCKCKGYAKQKSIADYVDTMFFGNVKADTWTPAMKYREENKNCLCSGCTDKLAIAKKISKKLNCRSDDIFNYTYDKPIGVSWLFLTGLNIELTPTPNFKELYKIICEERKPRERMNPAVDFDTTHNKALLPILFSGMRIPY